MHAAATQSPASSSFQPQTEEEEQAVPDYAEVSPQTAMHPDANQHVSSSSSSQSHAEEEEGSEQGRLYQRAEVVGHSHNTKVPNSSSSDLASSQQSHGSSCSSSSEHAQHQDRRQSGAAASTTTANGSKQSSHNGSKNMDAREGRGVYSFCMCPGGQIVPTTTNPEELCINGMSFRCAPSAYFLYDSRCSSTSAAPVGMIAKQSPKPPLTQVQFGLSDYIAVSACLPACLSLLTPLSPSNLCV